MRKALFCLIAGVAASTGMAAESSDGYRLVTANCQPHKPRFPLLYAKLAALRAAPSADRIHDVAVAVKDAQAKLNVEATISEIDLDGDGVCDEAVVVLDPIGTGGDADALTTFYLASKGDWQRIGAISSRSDRPADLDLIKSPSDQNFAFSDYALMRRSGQPTTFVVAWNHDRITNGFPGYRIFELDKSARALRAVDKWNGVGATVYADFKVARSADGVMLFDPTIEAGDLRSSCTATSISPELRTACDRFKR